MKSRSVNYLLCSFGAALTLTSATSLYAENTGSAPRLTRPAASSVDGKFNENATVGNIIVDTIGDMHRKIQSFKTPEVARILAKQLYCNQSGTSEVIKISVWDVLKKKRKEQIALLRNGDPVATHLIALETIGHLDDVNAQAIITDENIGPGVYRDPVAGMEQALQACDFYGHLR
jgi:hypothetical protein